MGTVTPSIDQEEPHLTSAAQGAHCAGGESRQIRHTLVDMAFEHLGSLLIKPHTTLRVSCRVVSTERRRVISGHDPTLLQKPISTICSTLLRKLNDVLLAVSTSAGTAPPAPWPANRRWRWASEARWDGPTPLGGFGGKRTRHVVSVV